MLEDGCPSFLRAGSGDQSSSSYCLRTDSSRKSGTSTGAESLSAERHAWMQARSLSPLLGGEKSPDEHREFVRCEFYDALDQADGTFATMYRDRRYKLVVYHGHGLGELYDLEEDPGEFDNLWDNPDHAHVKLDLMQRSFDASMLAMDRGPERIGPM